MDPELMLASLPLLQRRSLSLGCSVGCCVQAAADQ
jgi:hypothetical protein